MTRTRSYKIKTVVGRIGLISDTHGLFRPEVSPVLHGVDLIIHAGDIGKRDVLDNLSQIAPVYAIKGNNDRDAWARRIPDTMLLHVGRLKLYVIHALQDLRVNPAAKGFRAVISGHSHKPSIAVRDGVLYVNPGSAGPRRFKLPVSVGRLHIRKGKVSAELIDLLNESR
jgi:putative phosphoesterase